MLLPRHCTASIFVGAAFLIARESATSIADATFASGAMLTTNNVAPTRAGSRFVMEFILPLRRLTVSWDIEKYSATFTGSKMRIDVLRCLQATKCFVGYSPPSAMPAGSEFIERALEAPLKENWRKKSSGRRTANSAKALVAELAIVPAVRRANA